MPALERHEGGAEVPQQVARGALRDARVAGPERAGLRLGDHEAAGEVRIGLAQRRGKQHRLVLEPPGLPHGHDVEGGRGRGPHAHGA